MIVRSFCKRHVLISRRCPPTATLLVIISFKTDVILFSNRPRNVSPAWHNQSSLTCGVARISSNQKTTRRLFSFVYLNHRQRFVRLDPCCRRRRRCRRGRRLRYARVRRGDVGLGCKKNKKGVANFKNMSLRGRAGTKKRCETQQTNAHEVFLFS